MLLQIEEINKKVREIKRQIKNIKTAYKIQTKQDIPKQRKKILPASRGR